MVGRVGHAGNRLGRARSRRLAAAPIAAAVVLGLAGLALGDGLDRRFGDRGTIDQSFAPLAPDAAAGSISVLGDDRFIVAGIASDGMADGYALARYEPDGELDRTFSGDGLEVVPESASTGDVAVRALADDRTVIAGGVYPSAGPREAVVTRLLPDGSPDTAYGSGGTARAPVGEDEYFGDAAIGPDGSAVFATIADAGLRVRRIDSAGTPDPAFGSGGVQTVDLPGPDIVFGGISLDANGRPVIAVGAGNQSGKTDLYVVRLDATGALDASFSGDGVTKADVGHNDLGGEVAFDPSGRLLVADSLNHRQGLVRFEANGTHDNGFGESGAFVHSSFYGFVSNVVDDPEGVVTQGKRIYLFTETGVGGGGDDFLLMSLRRNGTLDRSFSRDGKVRVDFGGIDGPYAGAVQSSGRVLLAGYHGEGGVNNPELTFAIAGFRRGG